MDYFPAQNYGANTLIMHMNDAGELTVNIVWTICYSSAWITSFRVQLLNMHPLYFHDICLELLPKIVSSRRMSGHLIPSYCIIISEAL